MNKTVKDLSDLELGSAALRGQQQLTMLTTELQNILRELELRLDLAKEVVEEQPKDE